MSDRIHALAQLMFGKASLEECSVQDIETITKKYPYFSPAQFLLLQKLKQENSEAYNQQLQRSLLHFHDPLQFEYFIHSEKFYLDVSPLPVKLEEDEDEESVEPSISEIEQTSEVASETEQIESEEKIEEHVVSPEIKHQQQAIHSHQKNDLVFEPYHTVDYFASQGIKASLEAPKDKFGKQLKSFTDWLKTMKKLPASDLPKNLEASGEKTVVNLATHSVDETQVVTEAMAEVWVKQGNHEKAIEIYNKLSLLNPSKKAFFAAKIENLKRS